MFVSHFSNVDKFRSAKHFLQSTVTFTFLFTSLCTCVVLTLYMWYMCVWVYMTVLACRGQTKT